MKNKYFYLKHSLLAFLTLSRIPFSIILSVNILKHTHFSSAMLLLYCLTLFTDFIDGKLARSLNSESRHGAVLDVSTDAFFILSISFSLWWKGFFPLWLIGIILIKLLEFVITSRILAKKRRKTTIFVFDYLGRIVSASYYILPLLVLLGASYFKNTIFDTLITASFRLIAFLSIISLIDRLRLVKKRKGGN